MVLAATVLLLHSAVCLGNTPASPNTGANEESGRPTETLSLARAEGNLRANSSDFETILLPSPSEISPVPANALALAKSSTTTKKAAGAQPDPNNATNSLAGILVPDPAARGAFRAGPGEVIHTRRPWSILLVAQHSAATFDAWSTRRALSRGRMVEADPFIRPFAGSSALYGAIQAGPALLDYAGYRMRGSQNHWVRRLWWLPQSAGTAAFLFSGIHNLVRTR